ncbi:MAG: hypothetical protein WBW73_10125 [Rhodoplanes sp.]
MPVSDEIGLAAAVAVAGEHLQDIHNFTQREIRDDARVRFPRGIMREAQHYRQLCPDHLEEKRASSCAYAFMWLDVLWWLNNRTDLVLTGREMAIKSSVITLGTIAEAMLTIPFQPGFGNDQDFRTRLSNAHQRGWIDENDQRILKELWNKRNRVHLRRLDVSEPTLI